MLSMSQNASQKMDLSKELASVKEALSKDISSVKDDIKTVKDDIKTIADKFERTNEKYAGMDRLVNQLQLQVNLAARDRDS
ncbi:hypothetical protein HXX76_014207 [Chlamydomonas incerta]|uniref:Uncharacterized protein n=1 Tax=Chlamydomonas incerta TaxID=51695 RepID=A0A835VT19_CHLIN|nr:hypothetical protein HXX76_014207 [Chlamydomonas incerta]|eukprot:KAG2424783.1 hypothetical protein HXX76_014207 [Chlamydomonas incerta]